MSIITTWFRAAVNQNLSIKKVFTVNYNGVDVSSTGFMPSKEEVGKYIEYIIQKRNCKMSDIAKLNLTLEGENSVAMDYELKERRFERIRRIN